MTKLISQITGVAVLNKRDEGWIDLDLLQLMSEL